MGNEPGKTAVPRSATKRIGMFLVGVLLLAAAVWLLAPNRESASMSVYQGKTARQWFDVLLTNRMDALVAFRGMGSNAVPFLLNELARKDTAWDKLWHSTYLKLPLPISKHISRPQSQNMRWNSAAILLSDLKFRSEIPPLLQLSGNGDDGQQFFALNLLEYLVKPGDTNCIPSMTNCLSSTNYHVCISAARVLQRLQSGKLAIAPLSNFMNSPNMEVRAQCEETLERIDWANAMTWRQMLTNYDFPPWRAVQPNQAQPSGKR